MAVLPVEDGNSATDCAPGESCCVAGGKASVAPAGQRDAGGDEETGCGEHLRQVRKHNAVGVYYLAVTKIQIVRPFV